MAFYQLEDTYSRLHTVAHLHDILLQQILTTSLTYL